jgi:glycosyltransferase involved in cell wall biosynthesis
MISVIVPTHNRRKLLEKKLKALEAQQQPFEVIVIADGCTDDTAAFLQTYKPTYDLSCLETPGKGVSFARNLGAKEAKGDVLLFSDDDVIPSSGWIEAHAKVHAVANCIGVGRLVLPKELVGTGAAELPGPQVYWWNITGNSSSIPKHLFMQVGGYDETFLEYGGEDPDLGYRLKKAGATLVFVSAEAVHEAWSHQGSAMDKAYKAGQAHVKVWRKHKASKIAWVLGVHPVVLGVKRFVLPLLKPIIGQRGDYELAYMKGALSELQKRDNLKLS